MTVPLTHSGRRARAPSCALKIQRASTYFNNLTPNCVTITEPVSDRKEQKFSVRRSARIARQDSRFGCRQFPAQAFHDQSVYLFKELLRDSDAFLALRIDGLLEHDNLRFLCARSYQTRQDHSSAEGALSAYTGGYVGTRLAVDRLQDSDLCRNKLNGTYAAASAGAATRRRFQPRRR